MKKRHRIPVALAVATLLALVPATTAGAYPEPDVSPKICDNANGTALGQPHQQRGV